MDISSHDLDKVPPPEQPFRDEAPDTRFRREDDRWNLKNQLRDWFFLLVMIVIYLAWTGLVYLLEPGIR
jgi:hypothetical protein